MYKYQLNMDRHRKSLFSHQLSDYIKSFHVVNSELRVCHYFHSLSIPAVSTMASSYSIEQQTSLLIATAALYSVPVDEPSQELP